MGLVTNISHIENQMLIRIHRFNSSPYSTRNNLHELFVGLQGNVIFSSLFLHLLKNYGLRIVHLEVFQ